MITILGPTACGKTQLAVKVAEKIKAEIISADSRQVYKHMDIGTGKDLSEYFINGKCIPYHLINIVNPGYAYNVHLYLKDFYTAYEKIKQQVKTVVFCGGSGMYIEAVLKGYDLMNVPFNETLRKDLEQKNLSELTAVLNGLKKIHNVSDIKDKERLLRAIEIEVYQQNNRDLKRNFKPLQSIIFGINYPRELIRERITKRLAIRLKNGMIEEVKTLLNLGLTPEQLKYYGLEYKYLTMYICEEIGYEEMFRLLNTAIHQFAKRQMTWFRRMEKQGFAINWIDGLLDDDKKAEYILSLYSSH